MQGVKIIYYAELLHGKTITHIFYRSHSV